MDRRDRVYFLPNPNRPEQLLGRLSDGEAAYLDRQARKIPVAGETWDCIVLDTKGGRFVVPQEKVGDAGPLAGPLSTFDAFLKTNEGTEFWRHVEQSVERRADEQVFELTAEIRRKGEASSRRLEAMEARLSGIEKDLGEEEDWTDDQITARILHQLVRKGCWGGKHTSGKHFKRGPLKDVPWRRLAPIVDDLVTRGLLQEHSKSPDEHYSLASARKAEIEGLIEAQRDEIEEDEDEEPQAAQAAPAHVDTSNLVTKDSLRNALASLRQEIAARPHQAAAAPETDRADALRKLNEIDGQLRGLQGRITGLESRLDALPKVPARPPEPEKKPEPEKPRPEPKPAPARRVSDPVLVSMTALMLGDIRHAPKVKEHADRLLALKGPRFGGHAWDAGIHPPSACLTPGCTGPPEAVLPLLLLDKEGPQVLQALACGEHAANPRLAVAMGKGFQLPRELAATAVHAAQQMQEDLDMPLTPNMGPEMVTMIGFTDSDRKEWSFAGRQHWRKRTKNLPARVESPPWAWGPRFTPPVKSDAAQAPPTEP